MDISQTTMEKCYSTTNVSHNTMAMSHNTAELAKPTKLKKSKPKHTKMETGQIKNHQCVLTVHLQVIKSCLIWTSLCMLFEVVTIDLHYVTDRQERFDLKISKLKLLRKQRHLR